jgi:hypothetical protein
MVALPEPATVTVVSASVVRAVIVASAEKVNFAVARPVSSYAV